MKLFFVQLVSTDDPPEVPELKNVLGRINYENNLQKHENRRFTYDELQRFTNNFKRFIGQGGFGQVYYGCLEDNTEVAVKMRSESSSHGLDEFLAEVSNSVLEELMIPSLLSKFSIAHIYINVSNIRRFIQLNRFTLYFISYFIGSELDDGAS